MDITIDPAKSVDTGVELFDSHIQGEDSLDTANHPTATYTSNKVGSTDQPTRIEGTLTIRGVSGCHFT